jgi:putative transposase
LQHRQRDDTVTCMTRIARVVVPGVPHHITQRGNNRQDVFFTDADRRLYLALLKEESQRHGVKLLAYCLMRNHVHMVAVPHAAASLALALGRTHWRYARPINRLHGRSGHLWQNRFFSCALDDDHLLHSVCYAERNPVRARMVRLAWRYRWSSAAAHAGESADESGLLDLDQWRAMFPREQWRRILQRPEDERMTRQVRASLRTGRPLASDRWLARLEARLNRRLRSLPVGRPRRNKASASRTTKKK